jgi:hypothetical protein
LGIGAAASTLALVVVAPPKPREMPAPAGSGAKALVAAIKHILTLNQNLVFSYYVACAIKGNRGNIVAVEKALRNVIPHMFNETHENCGDWCIVNRDPTYKPVRMDGKWWGVDTPGVTAEVAEMWKAELWKVLESKFLTPERLKEIFLGLSSSPVECFNNTVTALASKRVFLGRKVTFRVLVKIAVLLWQLGNEWRTEVLEVMHIKVQEGDLTQIRTARADLRRQNQQDTRAGTAYKRYKCKMKARNKNLRWEARPTCQYNGDGVSIGAAAMVPSNPDEGVHQRVDEDEEGEVGDGGGEGAGGSEEEDSDSETDDDDDERPWKRRQPCDEDGAGV